MPRPIALRMMRCASSSVYVPHHPVDTVQVPKPSSEILMSVPWRVRNRMMFSFIRAKRGTKPPGPRLLPGECRLALLVVRAESFLGVFALEELLLQLALDRERALERNLPA